MDEIDNYIANELLARIDAVNDPVFSKFFEGLEDSDWEIVEYDAGEGALMQARALSVAGAKKVLQRIIETARNSGVDLKNWICKEFNICEKLSSVSIDALLRSLYGFLRNKWTQATSATLALIVAFAPSAPASVFALHKFLLILAALGVFTKFFWELCECEKAGEATLRA